MTGHTTAAAPSSAASDNPASRKRMRSAERFDPHSRPEGGQLARLGYTVINVGQGSRNHLNSPGYRQSVLSSVTAPQPPLKSAEEFSTACDKFIRLSLKGYVRFRSAPDSEDVFGASHSAVRSDVQGYAQSRFSDLVLVSDERVVDILEMHVPIPSRAAKRVGA